VLYFCLLFLMAFFCFFFVFYHPTEDVYYKPLYMICVYMGCVCVFAVMNIISYTAVQQCRCIPVGLVVAPYPPSAISVGPPAMARTKIIISFSIIIFWDEISNNNNNKTPFDLCHSMVHGAMLLRPGDDRRFLIF